MYIESHHYLSKNLKVYTYSARRVELFFQRITYYLDKKIFVYINIVIIMPIALAISLLQSHNNFSGATVIVLSST